MTDEETLRRGLIEGLSQDEKWRFFTVTRKFTDVVVHAYDDEGTICWHAVVKPGEYEGGITLSQPGHLTHTVLWHIRIGAWEFWESTIGRDKSDGMKEFTVHLP